MGPLRGDGSTCGKGLQYSLSDHIDGFFVWLHHKRGPPRWGIASLENIFSKQTYPLIGFVGYYTFEDSKLNK